MATETVNKRSQDHAQIAKAYDDHAKEWDERHGKDTANQMIETFLSKWDWTGTIFEVACGTGLTGAMLRRHAPSSTKIYGNDISPGMAEVASSKGIYDAKVSVGPFVEELKQSPPVEHIVCWGCTSHMSPEEFTENMEWMFKVATKSVTFSIDEIPDSFMDAIKDDPIAQVWFRNLDLWKKMDIPSSWKLVGDDRILAFTHPPTKTDIHTHAVRYEKS